MPIRTQKDMVRRAPDRARPESGTVIGGDDLSCGTLEAAASLLGKYLVIRNGRSTVSALITEVEAYDGPDDRASHAHRGMTPRNAPMFGPAGRWYVYLVYGMHWMLNMVTGPEGYPAAVLIRGVASVEGPGRVTAALGVDRRFDGQSATPRTGLWIEDRGFRVTPPMIVRTPRIGVAYAGDWASRPYRLLITDNGRSSTRRRPLSRSAHV